MRRAILIILLIFVCTYCFSDEDILIVTEEWAPYNYTHKDSVIGLSTEIIEKIMQITGKQYPIELLPSMRAKSLIDTRPKTILYSLFRTPERENNYRWIGPIIEENIYFYKLKENMIKITSLEDTKKVGSIACRRAGLIHDLLIERGYTNLDVSGTDSKQVYRKLLTKRCDLAISDTDIGVKYIFNLIDEPISSIEKIDIIFFTSALYIAFSKDISNEVYNSWNQTFTHLQKTGEIDLIIDKYY